MTTSAVRRRQTGLPPEFARLPMRMVRAATAAGVYAHPRAELARLTDMGLLHRVATGFYVADRPAVVRFVVRDTPRLDAEQIDTELGPVLVTTPEQTVLDLVKRPRLGDAEGEVWPAVEQLYRRCDPGVLAELAGAQKMRMTLVRLHARLAEKSET